MYFVKLEMLILFAALGTQTQWSNFGAALACTASDVWT